MNLEPIDTSTTAGKAELKPCPFCGGSARQESYIEEACVFCRACDARVRAYHDAKEDTGDAKSAQIWNTRAPQWQPIESAPRDGTFYLATDGVNQRVENCPEGYAVGIWHRIDGDWRGMALGDDSTHWQPLPAPPEVKP